MIYDPIIFLHQYRDHHFGYHGIIIWTYIITNNMICGFVAEFGWFDLMMIRWFFWGTPFLVLASWDPWSHNGCHAVFFRWTARKPSLHHEFYPTNTQEPRGWNTRCVPRSWLESRPGPVRIIIVESKFVAMTSGIHSSLVGGFNHLEKYESQWEGLSHIWNGK